MPALIGMVVLVFFPFLYGIALSFTNANIYNTDKPIAEIWVGLDNYVRHPRRLRRRRTQRRRALVFNYQNFYWTLVLHRRLDGHQRRPSA